MGHSHELPAHREHLPLPHGVTQHKLQHAFASILISCGEDPSYVVAQLGHVDPKFTLRVYTHAMQRDKGARERLKALVMGEQTVTETATTTCGEAV